jgi:hypothetical protein
MTVSKPNDPRVSDEASYLPTDVSGSGVKSYFQSVAAILAAAVPGTLLSQMATTSLGLTGVTLALATVFLSLALSVSFFVGLVVLGRRFKLIK